MKPGWKLRVAEREYFERKMKERNERIEKNKIALLHLMMNEYQIIEAYERKYETTLHPT